MAGADDLIFTSCVSTWEKIKEFRSTFGTLIAPGVNQAIQLFAASNEVAMDAAVGGTDFVAKRVFIMKLMILAGEVAHGLNDLSEQIRSTAERAFRHLQQLIFVDPEVRKKWKDAFATGGETECEKLGGVHLLWHGIQAFKAHGDGARTDLVFAEAVSEVDTVGVQGLVLTEWKNQSGRTPTWQFGSARRQAELYASGVLGGLELRGYRFLVLVSEKSVRLPLDLIENGVVNRHINIAVDPDPPSKASASGSI